MHPLLERITVLCFGSSYAVALALELAQCMRPSSWARALGLAFGIAGLLAHSIYVSVQPLDLATPFGSLLFLAWILAVFYVYGALHHRRQAWGLFVLPLVLGLVVLAALISPGADQGDGSFLRTLVSFQGERFWGVIHGTLVLLAAVGVSVGFVASVMYLVQVARLRNKALPGRGMKLLSLERLEDMNRRAILLAFPLLTAGLLVGIGLMVHGDETLGDWSSPKVLSALGLWAVFALLLFVRYGSRARGRQVALLTIAAFALLVITLAVPVHTFGQGGVP
jgi:ABC-type transport system involved in cytochrome c biogenesis permease subunit